MSSQSLPIHPQAPSLEKLRITLLPIRILALLLLLPVAVIVLRATIWEVPKVVTNLLVVDACLILLFLCARILLALEELRGGLIPRKAPSRKVHSGVTVAAVREEELAALLERNGYRCCLSCGQGIKKSAKTVAAYTLMLCGLLLLIPTGIYDYLHQFSGVTYVGAGDPIALNDMANYGFYSCGPLADYSDIVYKLKGFPNISPSDNYPEGAKELAVLDLAGGELWRGILTPRISHQEGAYRFHFHNFVYDVFLTLNTREDHSLIGEPVRLRVMNQPEGPYTHHGVFYNDAVKGEAWYDQHTDNVRVRATIKGKSIETIVGMGPDHIKEVDGYRFMHNGVGKWAQINVMRVRHIRLMKTGGILLAVGALLWLMFPLRRFWIVREGEQLQLISSDRTLCRALSTLSGENV